MSDLISRQEAIRWVLTECNPYGKPTLDFESGNKVIKHLEQMPSVQPEIIQCDQCKYWDGKPPITDGRYWCILHGYMYYCSDVERRNTNERTVQNHL